MAQMERTPKIFYDVQPLDSADAIDRTIDALN